MLEQSLYHKCLRILAVVFTFVLLFESGLVAESTVQLSQNTHQYLANAVGMSASVQPTELNTLTAELTEQRMLLDQREAALREREIEVELAGGGSNSLSTYLVASLLAILLVLIITNYVLDYLRYVGPRKVDVAAGVQ